MITMTNVLENKKMDMEVMENVNGGTVTQTREIWKTLVRKRVGVDGDVLNALPLLADRYLLVSDVSNCPIAYQCESILGKVFGMKANMSVGWGGSGFRESNNSYSIGNNTYSHEQVIEMIKTKIPYQH